MEAVRLPELEHLLESSPSDPIAYTKTFEDAKNDPMFILQSSSTVTTPERVLWTHWSINELDSRYLIGSSDGRRGRATSPPGTSKRIYCASPMFQSTGLADGLREICYSNTTVVLSQTQAVTADLVGSMIDRAGIDGAICLPSTLEDVAGTPDVLAKLHRLNHITYVRG
jgi:acyl-CoA synthetase (AMP-forming)/AMP-acid ligase II